MQALILAGGSGTRFWPLSRTSRPKQLLALESERSLLQETVDRLRPLVEPEAVWISTTSALADAVREQLPEVPPEQVLAEPVGRNTAPAIGWSVRAMPEAARRGVIAVLPADHRMADGAAFRGALERAATAARDEDRVMTLGVVPRWAETGYGYLELGAPAGATAGVRRVSRFVEKPDASRAAEFLASGGYLWNAGIFVFRGATFLAHLARLAPELAQGLEAMAAAGSPEAAARLYADLPALSVDYAVMEKLGDISTLPLDCGWSDLGSWEALYEALGEPLDGAAGEASHVEAGNAVHGGEALALESQGNLLVGDPQAPGVIAVLGVSGLVVVRTADAVLVCPRERSQDVRRLVDELKARGRRDLL